MKTDHLQSVSSAKLHVQPEYLIYQDFNFFLIGTPGLFKIVNKLIFHLKSFQDTPCCSCSLKITFNYRSVD